MFLLQGRGQDFVQGIFPPSSSVSSRSLSFSPVPFFSLSCPSPFPSLPPNLGCGEGCELPQHGRGRRFGHKRILAHLEQLLKRILSHSCGDIFRKRGLVFIGLLPVRVVWW